ncbi:hypothetical protein KIPB_009587, partial [Kipferlia bialata]|eukprot:g9587.t1
MSIGANGEGRREQVPQELPSYTDGRYGRPRQIWTPEADSTLHKLVAAYTDKRPDWEQIGQRLGVSSRQARGHYQACLCLCS